MTVYRLTDLPGLIPLYRADNASVFGVENRKLRFCIPNMLTQDCGMKIPGTWTFLTKNSPDLYEPSRSVVTVRNDAVALRQEIPFECWFADHGCNEPLTKKEAVKARFWALLALLEGALVTLIASVVVLALKIYTKVASKQHPSLARRVTILNAQWQGLKL